MKIIKIHPKDTVAVCMQDISKGETVSIENSPLTALQAIPAGHKIALTNIAKNENIIKYGFSIGHAKSDISAGSYVHTHNLGSDLGDILHYQYHPQYQNFKKIKPAEFMGYKRPDGKVGIRNEIWIIPTVGCVNSVVRTLETKAQCLQTENIDGIYAYHHSYGCSQLSEDLDNTLKFLAGLIQHPNAGGVLVVGLGCENGNIGELKRVLGSYNENRVKFLPCQEYEDEIEQGLEMLKELCAYASNFQRESCSVKKLTVGLKCGGSDAFSGITANPLLGAFSDALISMGGSAILTEVPEMFGAETVLMNRCRTEKQFDETVQLINDFKKYFMRYGEPVNENPSPGNKAGGITTLEEKSLGCIQKAGSAVIEDVLPYAHPVQKSGLSLLMAPGNDLVASCALAASGAQLVLFTTGRGTPIGCPVPTVKISSNTALFQQKKNWIDFNAGVLLSGVSLRELKEQFINFVLSAASGHIQLKSEQQDKHELAIFKDGVTL